MRGIGGKEAFFESTALSRAPWHPFLLLVPAVLPLFIHLGTVLWGSEARWLCIASEMRRTGDYLEPELNGEFYGDKPLLSYWAIAVLSFPLGFVDERVSRLPSAIAGALTVLLTASIAAKLFGKRPAILSGWILATSFSFYFWSRSASADVLNLAFTTAAVLVSLQWRSSPKPWHPLLFFNLLALGGHAKGMPAIIVPLGIVAADVLLRPSLWKWLWSQKDGLPEKLEHAWGAFRLGKLRWVAAGVASGLFLYALPFLASYSARHDWRLLSLMWKENFVRALDSFDHQAGVFYYVGALPPMFLPWSPWLLGALGWSGKRFRTHPGFRFSLLSFVVIFVLFTASGSRRSYYILPIFPFASILVAAFFDEMILLWDSRVAIQRVWASLVFVPNYLLAGALSLAAIFLVSGRFFSWPGREAWEARPYRSLCVLGASASLFFFLWAFRRRNLEGQILCAAFTALPAAFYYVTGVEDISEKSRIEPVFAREMKEKYPGLEPVYFRPNARIKYYLGPGRDASSAKDLQALLEKGPVEMFVVCAEENIAAFDEIPSREVIQLLTVSPPRIGLLKPGRGYSLLCLRRR